MMSSRLFNEILECFPRLGVDPDLINNRDKNGLAAPDWVTEGPIYEVFLRCFSSDGSFTALEKKIGYLKNLGIKTVWLMPIHPVGKTRRKGILGSPYAIRDHMVIDPQFGSERDFKNLIAAIHDHDMRIIMDMVLNHGADDHTIGNINKKVFSTSSERRSPADWTDVRDFAFNNKSYRKYFEKVLFYWATKFAIDGYRCDVAGLLPLAIWEKATTRLREIKPDFFMLAEWESSNFHLAAFHATYDWTLYSIMREVYAGRRPAGDLLQWQHDRLEHYPRNALPLRFTENHDLPRTTDTFGDHTLYPFVSLLFVFDGIPLIYAGQEIGASYSPALFEPDLINWNEKKERIFNFYRRLIRLRNHEKVFIAKDGFNPVKTDNDRLLAFSKKSDQHDYKIYINFSKDSQKVLSKGNRLNGGRITELISDDEVQQPREIRLDPYQVRIYKCEVS